MEHILGKVEQAPLELIAFRIAQQDYCFDIKRVREIRGWTPATPLPCSPSVLLGMINLRGTVIPVIDLSARLGFGATTPCSRHAILVIEIRDQILGLLVEAVSEILTIDKERVQKSPVIGSSIADKLVAGVISDSQRVVTILELDQIAEIDDLRDLSTVVANPPDTSILREATTMG